MGQLAGWVIHSFFENMQLMAVYTLIACTGIVFEINKIISHNDIFRDFW
jgi:hypothetical protein